MGEKKKKKKFYIKTTFLSRSLTSHAGTMKLLIPRKAAANAEKGQVRGSSCQIVAVGKVSGERCWSNAIEKQMEPRGSMPNEVYAQPTNNTKDKGGSCSWLVVTVVAGRERGETLFPVQRRGSTAGASGVNGPGKRKL